MRERTNLMDKQDMEMYGVITRKLLDWLAVKNDSNVVFSPFSVIVLLMLLADAAKGQTREEIIRAIGFGSDDQKMFDWITGIQKELMESGALVSSNAVCIKEDICDNLVPGYEKRLSEIFDGRLFSAKDMVNAINSWVNKKHGV